MITKKEPKTMKKIITTILFTLSYYYSICQTYPALYNKYHNQLRTEGIKRF